MIVESNRYGSAESVIRMSIKDLKRFAGAIVTLLPAVYVWLGNGWWRLEFFEFEANIELLTKNYRRLKVLFNFEAIGKIFFKC